MSELDAIMFVAGRHPIDGRPDRGPLSMTDVMARW
jgi:hypothetical protein